jgi:alpha-glucuronidase
MDAGTPMRAAARSELLRGLSGLLGRAPELRSNVDGNGAIIAGTPSASPQLAALRLDTADLGTEGFLIRSVRVNGRSATAIIANGDAGLLYGVFRYLRLLQTGQPVAQLDLRDVPRSSPTTSTRATRITHAPMPRWASTAPYSTT